MGDVGVASFVAFPLKKSIGKPRSGGQARCRFRCHCRESLAVDVYKLRYERVGSPALHNIRQPKFASLDGTRSSYLKYVWLLLWVGGVSNGFFKIEKRKLIGILRKHSA